MSKNDTLKMLEIWRSWEPCLEDIGKEATILNAMNEYAEWKIKNLNLHNVSNSKNDFK
jgi:hypothetical protein